ncbi:MAG: UDP-N-acetylglucosamine 2-epimerase (non-hydrolyzing), partial [Candidatus Omnitrophica bacterium]|nr:UDP-N-acetylglucosamine 2-epimerase (non-hydrolyzing) [Candidatus Omnitrophota bacterium]
MKRKKFACVVGARPNFMKMAPLMEALRPFSEEVSVQLIHTGQHYDERLSGLLFRQLALPQPNLYLGVGSGSHAQQTARVMMAFEEYCLEEKPDLVLLVGDVNSTLACCLVAAKLLIPVAHVEAGLRSRDRTMPEEINRIVVDALADILFTTCREADENLIREGIPKEKIHFVGNVMIDSLRKFLPQATPPSVLSRLEDPGQFGVVTLHRPANVDDPTTLRALVGSFMEVSANLPLIFPCHPRTHQRLREFGFEVDDSLSEDGSRLGESRVWMVPSLGYLEFIYLLDKAKVVLTDSGGIQEEVTVLGTPCLTLRENTERPITLDGGINTLVGRDPAVIREAMERVLSNGPVQPRVPEKWDGGSSTEIAQILVNWVRN